MKLQACVKDYVHIYRLGQNLCTPLPEKPDMISVVFLHWKLGLSRYTVFKLIPSLVLISVEEPAHITINNMKKKKVA